MSARADRMFEELMDTAAMQNRTPLDNRMSFITGFHQGLAFMHDEPELAMDLLGAIEGVFREGATALGPPDVSVQHVNDFLVRAARGDA